MVGWESDAIKHDAVLNSRAGTGSDRPESRRISEYIMKYEVM